MAEFKLERFKYNWRGDWVSNRSYKRDDVVRVNGKSYVCVVTHLSSSAFATDLTAILPGSIPPQPQPKWVVMTSGRSFIGNWTVGRTYNLGDVVNYNNSLWLCVVGHFATNFVTNFQNWEPFAQTVSYIASWTSGVAYGPGAVVRYGGNSYKCVTPHTSQSTLEDNASAWEEFYRGDRVRGTWASGQIYRINELVKYGGSIYRCIETHTSVSTGFDNAKFRIEVIGTQSDGDWDPEIFYNIGDVVRYRGFMYYAIRNNRGYRPYVDGGVSEDWILISRAYKFIGEWSVDTVYNPGDIVLRGGNLYLALRDIGVAQQIDGSTIDYLDGNTWELLVPGKSFNGNWTSGTDYSVGDVVYFKGSAYTCNFAHQASIVNFPGDNGSGYDFWDLLIQAGKEGGLIERGDILTYGLSRAIDSDGSTVFDGSTLGDVRLPIGETDQILSVTRDLEVYWRDIVDDADSVYVATNGVDAEGRGTVQKPFKTVRYAAEYVEDNYPPLTPVIIRISAGRFEEIGPIIVPAGCAVNGDELRSTTIVATPPIPAYQTDVDNDIVGSYLTYLETILLNILTGVVIPRSPGNTETQVTQNFVPLRDADGNIVVDSVTRQPILVDIFPDSGLAGASRVAELLQDYKDYIDFATTSGQNPPSITGSNDLNDDDEIVNAGEILYLNRNFLREELVAYLKTAFAANLIVDEDRIKNDIYSLIRAVRRDTKYSGNYATIFAARRYGNAVRGSRFDSIFFMRDSTGLRDLTTEGLRGTLNPPGVFDLYQKPTGGACVSLDPGWGPDDTRCWIINRSPYIQGVTNIGTGCVGKRVDGSLHNGGTKSMVSNDFTQVLSDGVGVWVSNNARTELVSVFTYYCQIGYFAEDGGIIRATNGNNSYGRYGSIADGVDATEDPQIATVFNRNNEAQILEAFAGGDTDELLILEYSNAGEEYSQATASITGAGANASVEFTDFRNGALFEGRLISADGSSSEGGSGYLTRQGSAQETFGASSTIKLSANDITQQLSEIQGMRIIITDGTGVGQYGYITGYTFATKVVTVNRESDGLPGWDHIIPGTPLATDLDLTTRYRIEPRLTVAAPPYSAQAFDLFTNRTYVDATFGDTTEIYNSVSGGSSIIWKDELTNYITVNEIISALAVKFNAKFTTSPAVPFNIKGRTSGTTATVTAISANTGELIEVDLSGNGNNFVVGEEIDIVLVAGTGETFDDEPVPAVFNVTRAGRTYIPTLVSGGAGYGVGNTIKILGSQLGGATPANDLTITVTSVSSDSTNSILSFTSSGLGKKGRFVSLTDSEYARYSDNGSTWTEVSLASSFIGAYKKLIAGNNRFIAVASNESRVSSSLTGQTWTAVNLPLSANWIDGVYGNGKFIIVANDSDVVVSSTNGVTWTTGVIPNDTVGDSTISQWSRVAYGKGKYVVVSANDRATATSTNGTSWTRHDQALPVGLSGTIVGLAYGNNRFVLVTTNGTAYSFDGITWIIGGSIGIVGFTARNVKYSNGIFLVIGGTSAGVAPTNYCATSQDGLIWTQRTLINNQLWGALAYGDVNGTSKWVLLASSASTGGINHVSVGARAIIRGDVVTGSFRNIKIWDPGSGYTTLSPPTITVTDPNVVTEVGIDSRFGNGVLAQPDFINRGTGYRKSSSIISISGNGYADIIPIGNTVTLAGIRTIPSPGVQIQFDGILNPVTEIADDLFIFSGVEVFDLGDDGTGNETRLVRFTITPSIGVVNTLTHTTSASLRERFSQCRISGHDFLDIGTGNFEQTNYPEIYSEGRFFTASPENEVLEQNSGRVFYVSTDQDGNFRTGELFSVQQATGIVTISAQFFDLDGLSELSLGGVRLGGSGTVVNEFSTDPTFAADSNNVIPTQRAIATFLANRLSVGGENLEANQITAGRVRFGGENNSIEITTGGLLQIPVDVDITGTFTSDDGEGNITTQQTQISGTIVSQMLFLKDFDDSMQ